MKGQQPSRNGIGRTSVGEGTAEGIREDTREGAIQVAAIQVEGIQVEGIRVEGIRRVAVRILRAVVGTTSRMWTASTCWSGSAGRPADGSSS